jgi:hypothetical protein
MSVGSPNVLSIEVEKRNMWAIGKKRFLVEEQDHECVGRSPWYWCVLDFLLRISFIKNIGLRNAMNVRVENAELVFGDLPKGFDDTRILLITDLHLDGVGTLAGKVVSIVSEIDYDYCILGGDYNRNRNTDRGQTPSQIKQMAKRLREKSRVFGVLGNYDRYSVADGFG